MPFQPRPKKIKDFFSDFQFVIFIGPGVFINYRTFIFPVHCCITS